jgi:stress response protein YsnF
MIRSKDFNSSYRNIFGNHHIQQFSVYTEMGERVGSVDDALVDPEGKFRYLVISPDAYLANNFVLLPLEQAHIDRQQLRIYLVGISKAQIRNLPAYHPTRSAANTSSSPSQTRPQPNAATQPVAEIPEIYTQPISVPVEVSAPLEGWTIDNQPVSSVAQVHHPIEQRSPDVKAPLQPQHRVSQTELQSEASSVVPSRLDARQDAHTQATIRLHEERLSIRRGNRRKVGEIIVRKEIETRLVEIPVRYEKLIVEQVSPNYEQLAVIDLEQDNSQALYRNHNLSSSTYFSENRSAAAANQFLQAIAHHPNPEYSRRLVQIAGEDAQLQVLYDQWLNHASRD